MSKEELKSLSVGVLLAVSDYELLQLLEFFTGDLITRIRYNIETEEEKKQFKRLEKIQTYFKEMLKKEVINNEY